TPADLEAWKKSILAEMDVTLERLDGVRAKLPAQAAARAATLLERREALGQRVREARVDLDGLVKTRYHGDLHLGQVLVVQDDFTIVDFEGEPERAVAERRAKHCVLRDVAGMLRSFSYAANAARLQRAAGEPATEAGSQALADWEAGAAHHFLQGYAKAAEGLASLPAKPEALRGLLDLFLIEKALYELRYESANRPDWIEIPLAGLLEIAQR
ncbi:MAG TPA: alpha-amylase, partial [Usitatibacter sp.]|nr:alpha-amylase [Usitatibacter sp.]